MSNIVPGCGPLDAPIWFIGKDPGTIDGASGRFLKDNCKDIGINPDLTRMENLMQILPPKNDFSIFETKENMPMLAESVNNLKLLIKRNRPTIVCTLGDKSLRYITGNSVISKWQGHVLWSEELDCKIIPLYDPQTCFRQLYVEKKQKPGQYKTLFQIGLKRVLKESSSRELPFPDTNYVSEPSGEQAIAILEDLYANANILSYDIETVGHCFMDCIGFSSDLHNGYCIPLYISNGSKMVPYHPSTSTLLEVFRLVKQLLGSDIPKVAQNSQFDTVFLQHFYNIHVRNVVWDTLIAAHDLYCDLPKDLGSLIALYTDLPYHKYMIKDDRHLYNAMDALANIHIMEGEKKEFADLKTLDHFLSIPMAATKCLTQMQTLGVKVDENLRNSSIDRERYIQEDVITALDRVFPKAFGTDKKFPHKFNPSSPQQKQKLFYGLLDCKRIYNKGVLTTDDEALEKFAEKDKRKYVGLLCKACQKYKAAGTMAGKLSAPLWNGRMCSSYDVTGTDTGRLSSSESIFDTGTNLQNLAPGVPRQMLISDEGEEFCIIDLWAAEAYTTALDAGEPVLLDMLNRGVKIHQWLLEETTNAFPEEVKEFHYDYKKAKIFVHGSNYNAQAEILSKETGLPIHVTTWQSNFYHSKFPGIKARMERIDIELRRTSSITSLLGRRRTFIAPWGDEVKKQAYAWGSQSTIGELTIVGMTKLYYLGLVKKPIWCFPAMNTHDGLAIRVKIGNREQIKSMVRDAFNVPLSKNGITIQIPVEIGFANNFNDVKDKEIIRYV